MARQPRFHARATTATRQEIVRRRQRFVLPGRTVQPLVRAGHPAEMRPDRCIRRCAIPHRCNGSPGRMQIGQLPSEIAHPAGALPKGPFTALRGRDPKNPAQHAGIDGQHQPIREPYFAHRSSSLCGTLLQRAAARYRPGGRRFKPHLVGNPVASRMPRRTVSTRRSDNTM